MPVIHSFHDFSSPETSHGLLGLLKESDFRQFQSQRRRLHDDEPLGLLPRRRGAVQHDVERRNESYTPAKRGAPPI